METEEKEEQIINPIEQVYTSIRSASLGILLVIFSATKLPFVSQQINALNSGHENCKETCIGASCEQLCDYVLEAVSAYSVMIVGLGLILLFSICGIVQAANPQTSCAEKQSLFGLILMLILCAGGLCYNLGYWILMSVYVKTASLNVPIFPFDTDASLNSNEHFRNLQLVILFFEYWLGGTAAVLFGMHCWNKLLDTAPYNVFGVLIQLMLVSLVLFIGYMFIAVKQSEFDADLWTLPLIATGYGMILCAGWICILFQFVKRDQTDKCQTITVYVIGVTMVTGSVLAAIGYWAEFNEWDPYNDTVNAWNTAYCLLLIGLCVFNAHDIVESRSTEYHTVPNK